MAADIDECALGDICRAPAGALQISHLSDIDECEQDLDDCDENSNCVDTIGSFECFCHVGYIKNGTQCISELHVI